MAVKAKNKKKLKMKELMDNSVRIKCKYCDIYETCKVKINKEKSENMGIITHCTLTPNLPKKSKKSKKLKSKGENNDFKYKR